MRQLHALAQLVLGIKTCIRSNVASSLFSLCIMLPIQQRSGLLQNVYILTAAGAVEVPKGDFKIPPAALFPRTMRVPRIGGRSVLT